MKIGALIALGMGAGRPEFLDMLGPALEERGFESIWVPEHVVLFDEMQSRYPYSPDGSLPVPPDLGLLDPFVALTYLAARTTTLRLGTGVLLVGQRNPVYTAKQAADLDVLSGGRVELGVGLGWLREEYEACGVPWAGRGKRVDENLAVLKTLWVDAVSEHRGPVYDLPPSRMYPKPVQRPHPPIHVGGDSEPAIRRAATLGDGWFGMGQTPEGLREAIGKLESALAEAGRSRAELTVNVSPLLPALDPATVEAYAEAGADRLIVPAIAMDRDSLLRALDDTAAATVAVLKG